MRKVTLENSRKLRIHLQAMEAKRTDAETESMILMEALMKTVDALMRVGRRVDNALELGERWDPRFHEHVSRSELLAIARIAGGTELMLAQRLIWNGISAAKNQSNESIPESGEATRCN